MADTIQSSEQIRIAQRTRMIREVAESAGFDIVRFTTADPFFTAQKAIQERIALDFFAGMDWFTAERAEVSANPKALLPEAQSMIALGIFYLIETAEPESVPGIPRGQISRYARGFDYHDIIRKRIEAFIKQLKTLPDPEFGDSFETRVFVDTGRMIDRAAAQRSGIGWFGKNANILSPKWGSWLFLAEIVSTLALQPDPPTALSCGKCAVCVTACPTGAIVAPGVVDARRCISYLTIEHRGAIPMELRPLIGNWIFGCDVCQTVCPVNTVAVSRLKKLGRTNPVLSDGSVSPFAPQSIEKSAPSLIPLLAITEEEFRVLFQKSPVKRAKRRGIRRNVCVALGNSKDTSAIPALAVAIGDEDALIRGHAAWALGQMQTSSAKDILLAALAAETNPEAAAEMRYALELLQ